MKLKLCLVLLAVCSLQANAQTKRFAIKKPAAQISTAAVKLQDADVLPIRRVILYSNGVAYIERRGTISGSAEVNLSFKQSQVDDVLKSMVVLDLGAGRIGAVSYNSSAPPAARMAEIPFSVDAQTNGDAGGIAGVLAQLQGARVAVQSTKTQAIGAILTVEKRTIKSEENKPAIETRFLVIAGETGELSSFDLNEVRSVKLLDEGTQKDVREFASATASARRRDAKTITVTSEGADAREMVVSYTIAAPIWKTTYRVVLDEAGKPFFQGWAIVDNVSEEDWSNVQLSLVSGTPISFIQQIQQPFYRYRPVVPMPEDLKLEPQTYEDGVPTQISSSASSAAESTADVSARKTSELPVNGRNFSQLQMMPNDSRARSNSMTTNGEASGEFRVGVPPATSISSAITSGTSGVDTAATGEQLGDLFEYKIAQAVTVKRDRSALIPIVQTKMDGERISIYNDAVRRDRPMSGMLLKNLTDLTLESGALTVIDRDAYAGEALMERLKPKEQRLISFALDLGTLVTTKQEEDREAARLVKAVNGTFQVHYFKTDKKVFTLQNQSDRDRTVFIEHPVRQGWDLTDETLKPAITTQRYYRFRVELKPFAKETVTVGERQALMDSYVLRDLARTDVEMFIARRYINDATRQKLEKLLDLRQQINQIQVRLAGFDAEVEAITEDQERLRENIEALAKTPEAKTLIARYIAKADQQETRLEQITKERQTLQIEQQRLENELAALIRIFDV